MPIFMDRHDMKGTRPEDVAQDHLKDLEVQDRYGVKWLTYWFDQERGTTFCLVDAPDKETAERAHREAHGHVAGEIIEVSLSAVEAFLGGPDNVGEHCVSMTRWFVGLSAGGAAEAGHRIDPDRAGSRDQNHHAHGYAVPPRLTRS